MLYMILKVPYKNLLLNSLCEVTQDDKSLLHAFIFSNAMRLKSKKIMLLKNYNIRIA